MPTLNWIGKDAVVKHHKEVPFRMLEPDAKLSHGDDEENLIVQGDNLHALKALLPKYAGRVKCIYIDPPYNTGNEGWVYNDNVKAPEIQKWLGETVGKEAEDLSRHDKWLCMMYPRMVLLKQFLAEDGAIFVSIDDNEVASLRLLMDEVFGRKNFVTEIMWQKIYTVKNSAKHLSEMHDHIVLYAKNKNDWHRNLLPRSDKAKESYTNRDEDSRGAWTDNALQARNYNGAGIYAIKCPGGKLIKGPPSGTYWRMSEEKFWALNSDNRVWWGKSGNNAPRIKKFISEAKKGVVPSTWWKHEFAGTNSGAKTELREILSEEYSNVFNTPKPWQLIQRILQLSTDKDSIILDSFAGSGTTGHAVLKQNGEDGGNRKFILVEMEQNIAENITAERVRRVAKGYKDAKGKDVAGLGSGFQFCRLSDEPLFDSDGQVREDISYDELAEFVWFSETGSAWPGWAKKGKEKKAKFHADGSIKSYPRGPLLGVKDGHAFVLLFNGILSDRTDLGGNVLNQRTLEYLQEKIDHARPMTVFAARCRFGPERLRALGITYKQLPYRLNDSLYS